MADALSVIPTNVLHNLFDKLYEKRKNAALEFEGIVKSLTAAGDHEKISSVIQLLTQNFTYSPQANHRKVLRVLITICKLFAGLMCIYGAQLFCNL